MSQKPANQYPATMTANPGFDFEHAIQTYFLLIMLLGKTPPFIDPNAKIKKIILQFKQHFGDCGPTYNTDDLVVCANANSHDFKILVNIKEEIDIKSQQFADVVKNAYLDITSEDFIQENDIVLLVTRTLDAKKSGLIRIANIAKCTHSYEEAFSLGNRDKAEKLALNIIEDYLKGGEINATRDDIYVFLRNFDILSMDIRQDVNKEGYPGILSLICNMIKDNCKHAIDPYSVWLELKEITTVTDNISNIIDIDNLPLQLLEIRQKYFTDGEESNHGHQAITPTNIATILLGEIDSSKEGDLALFNDLNQEIK